MTSSDFQENEVAASSEQALLQRLRAGDESAFEKLVMLYNAPMLRLASMYVANSRLAEEVVQDTWIGMLRGLDRFEGRSSLKTWLFSILVNRARTNARREGRYVPLETGEEEYEPSVGSERFHPQDHPGHGEWVARPASWDEIPEEHLSSKETLDHIYRAIRSLSEQQREVITMRDIEQWSAEEVCNVLGLNETNQRVLLHRARSKVRQQLENYLNE